MEVIEINDADFKESLGEAAKVVIDCYAPWCGPCKMLSPVIEQLAEENEEVRFFKLNIDDNDDTASEYDIMSIPTVLIFENGELKEKLVGFRTKDELEEIIK